MAVIDVYCNVLMNLDEDNILNKTLFTFTFMVNFTCLFKMKSYLLEVLIRF